MPKKQIAPASDDASPTLEDTNVAALTIVVNLHELAAPNARYVLTKAAELFEEFVGQFDTEMPTKHAIV